MKRTLSLIAVLFTIAAATLLFWLFLHQISSVWLDVALRPEVRTALERSMEDQKSLRKLDPARRAIYRRRFDETQRLLNRIEVIRLNREAMLRRFELTLILVFAIAACSAAILLWLRHRAARARERREYAQRMASLQETARRHAHEIKGPLTAARLELERFADLVRAGASDEERALAEASITEELERLARYTREYSSFAGIGQPLLRRESLGQIVEEFCRTFANAWPGVMLRDDVADAIVCTDRELLRQVLVNLCSNSAAAGATSISFTIQKGASRVSLEVRDDGAGVPESLRARIFDPYVTTKKIGEGMGLGLAISRKVMLDHGGDLQMVASSQSGTIMRVVFGGNECV
ncbi:MAG: ATP-binding protein [Acidobacteriota bacterium]|nr:ATP-binding protein [Acidobacteriota bacterium]